MKKLALAICVVLGLAGIARATQIKEIKTQQQSGNLAMPLTAVCMETSVADKTLSKEYGERPFAQGVAIVWNSKIQDYLEVMAKIYLNSKDFSFTIAYEVPEDGLTCIVATGNNFQPAYGGPKI